MGNSLTSKLKSLDSLTRSFITKEEISSITEMTQYNEDEVLRMLTRFQKLNPDIASFQISIADLKCIDEFKFNPYTNLALHAINIYKIIYDYIRINKGYSLDDFNIPVIYNLEVYEIYGNNFDAREEKIRDDDVSDIKKAIAKQENYVLKVENPGFEQNNKKVIDFKLFCIILNRFNKKRSMENKFRICFNMFDINKDNYVCLKDLKNFFYLFFGNSREEFFAKEEEKDKVIREFSEKILFEYRADDKNFQIDFNNFQKILWSTNFITNLSIEP